MALFTPEQARECLTHEGFIKIHEAKAEYRHFELWGHETDLRFPNRILSINYSLPEEPTARIYEEITSRYFGHSCSNEHHCEDKNCATLKG